MEAGRHLFLDLEDTVITPVHRGWAFCDAINLARVRGFIESWSPTTVNLFSFALHDESDVKEFDTHVRPFLERDLGVSISMVPTTDDDILGACCRQMRLHRAKVDFDDMSSFWSKHQAFRLFVKDLAGNGVDGGSAVALVDDAVEDERFEWPALRLSGLIVNVASLDEAGRLLF